MLATAEQRVVAHLPFEPIASGELRLNSGKALLGRLWQHHVMLERFGRYERGERFTAPEAQREFLKRSFRFHGRFVGCRTGARLLQDRVQLVGKLPVSGSALVFYDLAGKAIQVRLGAAGDGADDARISAVTLNQLSIPLMTTLSGRQAFGSRRRPVSPPEVRIAIHHSFFPSEWRGRAA